MDGSIPFWMYIIGFPLLLGPLVTLHELGHYLVGRWFGVKAEAFSVGFGKEIAGFTDRHGTRWKLSVLPLGGYVQFKGDMNPASVPDPEAIAQATPEERSGSFHHAALWKRALIVFAGPAMNILIAFGIFAAFFMAFGKPVAEPVVSGFSENSVAEAAGIEIGDRITAIDGARIEDFYEVRDRVALYPGKAMEVTVERGGRTLDFPLVTEDYLFTDEHGNEGRIGLLGVTSGSLAFEPQGALASLALSAESNWRIVTMMVEGVRQIVVGDRSLDELGGPVKIAKYSGEKLSQGPLPFIEFLALISLNLAFINLLPIPALDGGHLAFYAAEAIRRKPLGPRSTEVAYRAGVAVVLALMIFVTVNDLVGLPIFGN